MKHRIFSTWGTTPIKNVPTSICRFSGDSEEDIETAVEVMNPQEVTPSEPEMLALQMMSEIRLLVIILIILKVACLIFRH